MNHKNDDEAELEPEATAEERAQAEALARALEPGPARATAPDDALATAALLRHARRAQDPGEAARGDVRVAAAAARVLPAVDRRRRSPGRWLLPALLVPASAAALVLISTVATRSRLSPAAMSENAGAPAGRRVPPPVELLEAQAQAAHSGADLSALDQQMRDYRRAYYAAVGGGAGEEP